ncbi:MAG: non-hydrolyzing UDP-N-acetylglucosamine 2-epimerase [Nitrospiria bacterium]
MKIILVAGARPNFMKIAPLMEAINRFNQNGERILEPILVHTGQHYDYAMSQLFFDDLGLPRPDINLEVGSGTHAEQTGKVMMAFEQVLEKIRPDLVIVVGDVNSTPACAITAKKLKIPVAHVEAGLRSGDMTMPEEINRRLTDFISDYLFTTDLNASENLKQEGIPDDKIFFVGNVMIDTLLKHLERASTSSIHNQLDLREGKKIKPYGVVTLHRPSNVDHYQTFREICEALNHISVTLPLIFPCHPRTQERIKAYGLDYLFGKSLLNGENLIITSPLGYLDFLHLNAGARIILTDSGGIQEESTILGVPCLTLRENTERPMTISQGTNRLVGARKENILNGFKLAMESPKGSFQKPEKWDGQAAERIVEILAGIAKKKEQALKEEQSLAV